MNDNNQGHEGLEKKEVMSIDDAKQAMGKATQVAGTASTVAGTGTKYLGKGISGVGKGMSKLGTALNKTQYGAIIGVPLKALGGLTRFIGKGTEIAGSGLKRIGNNTKAVASKKNNTKDNQTKNIEKKVKTDTIEDSPIKLVKKILENKHIIITLLASFFGTFFMCSIFIIIIITPLIELGIIDISDIGIGGTSGNSTPTENNITYWWPVDSNKSAISSYYGYRTDPQTGERTQHNGIDITTGDVPGVINIIAANSGVVTSIKNGCPTTKSITDEDTTDDECGGKYGNFVIIKHEDQNVTVYAHLYSVSVSNGATVRKGQVLGTMGSSGRSTGTHLHFEVRVNSQRVNPTSYVSITNRKP